MAYFFHRDLSKAESYIKLSEETAKHCIQVLRMQVHDTMQLVNGKGLCATVKIVEAHKKHCNVEVVSVEETVKPAIQHTIAISLVKNTARFEWFLEKATEIGISNFVPLICKRTERSQFKKERLEAILISAMLQSKQTWLPTLAEPILFADYCNTCTTANKLIAHCVEERKLSITAIPPAKSYTVLIGPEGDFTNEEISIALKAHFEPVALGNTRLRTETAGLVAAAWLQLTNQL